MFGPVKGTVLFVLLSLLFVALQVVPAAGLALLIYGVGHFLDTAIVTEKSFWFLSVFSCVVLLALRGLAANFNRYAKVVHKIVTDKIKADFIEEMKTNPELRKEVNKLKEEFLKFKDNVKAAKEPKNETTSNNSDN